MSLDGTATIVPSDGWGQLLIYRKDLFKKAGIDAPRRSRTSARPRRSSNGGDMAGIVAGHGAG